MISRVNRIYESVLLEMDERVIEYLNDNKEDLPFEHIFGDDLRIVIPIYGDPTAKEILNTLKRIRDYGGLDLDSGDVIRKIQTQQGEKNQRIKMGSAISKMKLSDEDKKRYLDWLARYKDNMGGLGEPVYSIVLSRAPIDVLRMSDHSGWSSCHSQDGSEFQCAVQEAINGGAIAYVVKTKELNEYLEENSLEDEEMFYDRDRYDAASLEPLSRLRVRRLASKNAEMAIPDTKIYGSNSIPGFYESLVEFLKEKQPMDYESFKEQEWKKRGGTYYDSNISNLITSYYKPDEDFPNYINHHDSDRYGELNRNQEIKQMFNNLEEECSNIKASFDRRMKYCEVNYDIQWDDNAYCMPYASASVEFDYDLDYSNIDISFDDSSEVENAEQGSYDDEITWSGLLYWISKNCKHDINSFSFIKNRMEITFSSDEVFFHSDEFDGYCLDIDKFDDALIEAFAEPNDWMDIFKEIGIIPNQIHIDQMNRLLNEGSEQMTVSNNYGDRGASWMLYVDTKKQETLNTYKEVDIRYIGNGFTIMLVNYIQSQYHPTPLPKFSDFFESYRPIMDGVHRQLINNNDIDNISFDLTLSNSVVEMEFKIEVESFTQKNADLILFLDQNYDDLKNMATMMYLGGSGNNLLSNPEQKGLYDRLFKVYGKFSN